MSSSTRRATIRHFFEPNDLREASGDHDIIGAGSSDENSLSARRFPHPSNGPRAGNRLFAPRRRRTARLDAQAEAPDGLLEKCCILQAAHRTTAAGWVPRVGRHAVPGAKWHVTINPRREKRPVASVPANALAAKTGPVGSSSDYLAVELAVGATRMPRRLARSIACFIAPEAFASSRNSLT